MECGVYGMDGQVAVGAVEEEVKQKHGVVRIQLHLLEEDNVVDIQYHLETAILKDVDVCCFKFLAFPKILLIFMYKIKLTNTYLTFEMI